MKKYQIDGEQLLLWRERLLALFRCSRKERGQTLSAMLGSIDSILASRNHQDKSCP